MEVSMEILGIFNDFKIESMVEAANYLVKLEIEMVYDFKEIIYFE